MRFVGVTGTNGKTSTVLALHQLGLRLGRQVLSCSSEGLIFNETPLDLRICELGADPASIAKSIKTLAGNLPDTGWVLIELTSLWLDQGLHRAFIFSAGVLTSIGSDHLDIHGSQEDYEALKTGFVYELASQCPVIVSPGLVHRFPGLPDIYTPSAAAAQGEESSGDEHVTKFWGNRALAARTALALAEGEAAIAAALPHMQRPPGRELWLGGAGGRACLIDTAHNPQAVQAALAAASPHGKGRLVAVLGAGGGRDATKRAPMARMAKTQADILVVTDDNPRGEDPGAIRQHLLGAAPDAIEIGGRAHAIRFALSLLEPGDHLAVLGMGEDEWIDDAGLVWRDADIVLQQKGWNITSRHWPPMRHHCPASCKTHQMPSDPKSREVVPLT